MFAQVPVTSAAIDICLNVEPVEGVPDIAVGERIGPIMAPSELGEDFVGNKSWRSCS